MDDVATVATRVLTGDLGPLIESHAGTSVLGVSRDMVSDAECGALHKRWFDTGCVGETESEKGCMDRVASDQRCIGKPTYKGYIRDRYWPKEAELTDVYAAIESTIPDREARRLLSNRIDPDDDERIDLMHIYISWSQDNDIHCLLSFFWRPDINDSDEEETDVRVKFDYYFGDEWTTGGEAFITLTKALEIVKAFCTERVVKPCIRQGPAMWRGRHTGQTISVYDRTEGMTCILRMKCT
jgi:hypothetical protein